jgi:N-acetylneuraminic acid mutarotase
VGGATANYDTIRNDVWRSTNGGVQWTKMTATNLPARFGAAVVVDDKAKLYVVGGIAANGVILNDLWTSTNNGGSFSAPSARPGFMASNGRAKAFLLHRRSWQLNKDVLYFGAGWNSQTLMNDIWASSDDGASWTQVCAAAPFSRRDASSAEITNSGLIVVAGGQAPNEVVNDGQQTNRETGSLTQPQHDDSSPPSRCSPHPPVSFSFQSG